MTRSVIRASLQVGKTQSRVKKTMRNQLTKESPAKHYLFLKRRHHPPPDGQAQPEKPPVTLAEKTVGEVLRHFGSDLNEARLHYRAFVEKVIMLGRRPEFQGGGLVRSAGGNKAFCGQSLNH